MIIIDGKTPLSEDINTKIVIGKFDGVHVGHRRLIRKMIEENDGLKSVVFTFSFDSTVTFNSDHIYSEKEKENIFRELGVDYLVEYHLDKESASISPEDFVRQVLVNTLHVKTVFCGPDLSFGKRGAGNIDTIRGLSKELGIDVCVVQKEQYKGVDISSTRIRNSIDKGQNDEAEKMLGRPIGDYVQ